MHLRAHSRERNARTFRSLNITSIAAFTATLSLFPASPIGATTIASPPITVDGATTDVAALERDGKVFVPVRGVFEKLGATVNYTPPDSIVARKGGKDLASMALGSRHAEVHGANTAEAVAPFSSHGRVMVPLRLISEAAGATVVYRSNPRAVGITRAVARIAAPVQVAQAAPAADATTAPADAQTQSQGIPWWVWAVAALLILALIAFFFLRRKKEPIITTTSKTRKAPEPKITTRS